MSSLFNWLTEASMPSKSRVSIEILSSVIDRITNTVLNTRIEDGGKLLGKIVMDREGLRISVETFIDSGPNVSSSESHLQPDGEYQEAVFRVIEIYEPSIEHLGSWHSHHCNGLARLSEGDIRGYIKTVNKSNYNLDYFFAFLVTAVHRKKIEFKTYLFFRGREDYVELDESTLRIVDGSSGLDPLLVAAENASRDFRRRESTPHPPTRMGDNPGLLRQIRAADHRWISSRFPNARSVMNRKSGVLSWRWSLSNDLQRIDVRYEYPPQTNGHILEPASLEIRIGAKLLVREDVFLDDARWEIIERHITRVAAS